MPGSILSSHAGKALFMPRTVPCHFVLCWESNAHATDSTLPYPRVQPQAQTGNIHAGYKWTARSLGSAGRTRCLRSTAHPGQQLCRKPPHFLRLCSEGSFALFQGVRTTEAIEYAHTAIRHGTVVSSLRVLMHSSATANVCSIRTGSYAQRPYLLPPARAMAAPPKDMQSQVRAKLVEAFTHGRQRMAKPIVLPVVDRPGPAAPSGLDVEELELCSEPQHPHGQGWVPLRIMYKRRTPTKGATHSTAAATAPDSMQDAACLPVSDGTQIAGVPTLPAVTAALSTTMAVTPSSFEAAHTVLARVSPSPVTASHAAGAAEGPWSGRQHASTLPPPSTSESAGSDSTSDAEQTQDATGGVDASSSPGISTEQTDPIQQCQTETSVPIGQQQTGSRQGVTEGPGELKQEGAADQGEFVQEGTEGPEGQSDQEGRDAASAADAPLGLGVDADPFTTPAARRELSLVETDESGAQLLTNGTQPDEGGMQSEYHDSVPGIHTAGAGPGHCAPSEHAVQPSLLHAPFPAAATVEPASVDSRTVHQVHQKLNSCSAAGALPENGSATHLGAQAAVVPAAPVKLPVVILLHSTGSDMGRMRSEQEACARAGYLAVAIDCRYHGFRCVVEHEGQLKRDVYQTALVRAWREGKERPFLLDNLWDLSHLLDYLVTRPDVDPQRIGITGVSLGGMHAWLLAVADDRIAVTAPMIGVQGFGWAVQNKQWHARVDSVPKVFEAAAADLGKQEVDAEVMKAVWDKLLPGLLTEYDAPLSLSTVAPRPLLVANAELDPRCPLPGVLAAMDTAHKAYIDYYMTNLAGLEGYIHAGDDGPLQHGVIPNADDESCLEWGMCNQPSAAISTPNGHGRSEATGPQQQQVVGGSEATLPTVCKAVSTLVQGHIGTPKEHTQGAQPEACDGTSLPPKGEHSGNDIAAAEARDAAAMKAATARAAALEHARAWAAFRCALYVEPGAGHEERPGKWAAVRAFLDLHLRGVGRATAYAAALKKNVVTLGCHKAG